MIVREYDHDADFEGIRACFTEPSSNALANAVWIRGSASREKPDGGERRRRPVSVHEVEVSANVDPFGAQKGGAPHEVHVGEDRPLRAVEERRAAEEGELAHGDEVAVAACGARGSADWTRPLPWRCRCSPTPCHSRRRREGPRDPRRSSSVSPRQCVHRSSQEPARCSRARRRAGSRKLRPCPTARCSAPARRPPFRTRPLRSARPHHRRTARARCLKRHRRGPPTRSRSNARRRPTLPRRRSSRHRRAPRRRRGRGRRAHRVAFPRTSSSSLRPSDGRASVRSRSDRGVRRRPSPRRRGRPSPRPLRARLPVPRGPDRVR